MVYNFNSGPSILPQEVLDQAASAIHDFNGTGLSILEIGHRTKPIEAVVEESAALLKEMMNLDAGKEVLFLHGGATTQFFQVPMNLLDGKGTAAYLDCGIWGSKAIREARLFGEVKVVASSADRKHTYIPKGYDIPENAAYLHLTSNNTVEGTQMWEFPKTGVPLVADMSSDILSRELDFNRFSLIYAGAQKNIGVAGVTMVVVDSRMLGRVGRELPAMMDYRQHIENRSMLNTPPVFAIYVCLLTLRWLKRQGGLAALEKANREKAALLYDALESSPVFIPTVDKADRSHMNVVFVTRDPGQEKSFLELCQREGIVGVKGHRSVGGLRASLYNALPVSHVRHLVELMRHFEQSC
jgi:phosphoserine aminotransferase